MVANYYFGSQTLFPASWSALTNFVSFDLSVKPCRTLLAWSSGEAAEFQRIGSLTFWELAVCRTGALASTRGEIHLYRDPAVNQTALLQDQLRIEDYLAVLEAVDGQILDYTV